jgi:hypothetical protein
MSLQIARSLESCEKHARDEGNSDNGGLWKSFKDLQTIFACQSIRLEQRPIVCKESRGK